MELGIEFFWVIALIFQGHSIDRWAQLLTFIAFNFSLVETKSNSKKSVREMKIILFHFGGLMAMGIFFWRHILGHPVITIRKTFELFSFVATFQNGEFR